jgi:WD40 repeat protein
VLLFRAPSGTAAPAIEVLDPHTLKHLRFLPLDKRWLSTLTSGAEPLLASPDSRYAYLAYSEVDPDTQRDGAAYVDRWDARTGKLLETRAVGSKGMFDGYVERNGNVVLLTDTEIVTLDGKTLRRVRSKPVRLPYPSSMARASLAPDGQTVATAGLTDEVRFIDVGTGRTTKGVGGTGVSVQNMAFSPKGDTFVGTYDNGVVTVWNPKTGTVADTFKGHEDRVLGVAFSADGKTLFTCSLDGAILEWDLGHERRFGRPFAVTPIAAATQERLGLPALPPVAMSKDGTKFATRIGENAVGIFSVGTLHRVRSFAVDLGGPITAIAWSPGDELAIAGMGGRVQLWNVATRPRRVRSLAGMTSTTGLPAAVNQLAFSPDGRMLAAAGVNHTPGNTPPLGPVAAWQTATGKVLWKRANRQGPADSVAFSRDGKRLALGLEIGFGAVDQIVDPTSGRVERLIRPLGGSASQSLAFAPDGTLATGSWAGIVQRWDVSTGKQLGRPLLAMPAPVSSISFDPTGNEFATGGGSGGFVKLWDTHTLQQLGAAFPGEPGQWANAQFTPDGSQLVTLYSNGRGTVWPGTVRAWEDHACRVAGRNLTREEWRRFVRGRAYSKVC